MRRPLAWALSLSDPQRSVLVWSFMWMHEQQGYICSVFWLSVYQGHGLHTRHEWHSACFGISHEVIFGQIGFIQVCNAHMAIIIVTTCYPIIWIAVLVAVMTGPRSIRPELKPDWELLATNRTCLIHHCACIFLMESTEIVSNAPETFMISAIESYNLHTVPRLVVNDLTH
jgi:hypothetical protein